MKKLLFVASVFILLGSSSCKKDYTCYCVNATTSAVTNPTVKASNSSDATKACANLDGGNMAAGTYVSCTLE
jgi:hypothetical protein